VATSTIEAEYMALSDIQFALEIPENPANYSNANHINIHYHAIRPYPQNDLITVDFIPSNMQAPDIFTALRSLKYNEFVKFTKFI